MRRVARCAPALVLALVLAACAHSSGGAPSPSPTPPISSAAPTPTPTPSSSTATPPPAPPSPPAKPTSKSTPTPPRVPPLSAAARAAGLVDVRTIVPDAVVDLRYATADNFTHVRLYPVDARCLVHRSMAPGLATAARVLRQRHLRLVFWDCYRPHPVQVRMYEVVPDPNWVARPGAFATSHESGRSVDVTLADARTRRLLDMGTGFDDFTPRAYAFATSGITAREVADRAVLRTAMNAGGLVVYAGEWWHFDGPGSKVPRPFLNAPLD